MRALTLMAALAIGCSATPTAPLEGPPSTRGTPAISFDWDTLRRPIATAGAVASAACQFSGGRLPNDLPGARGFNSRVTADGRVSGYVAYGAAPAYLASAESTGGLKGAVFSYAALVRDERAQPKVIAIVEPGHAGPVLIRGVSADRSVTVRFGRSEAPTDEVRIESASGTHPLGYLQVSGPGCYVIQFDTASFSSRVIMLFER